MLELLMGIWIGRATKGANPFAVVASFFVALAILAVAGATAFAIWHYAPQAYTVVEWAGVGEYVPFLDLHVHDIHGDEVLGIMQELPSRMVLCSVALLVLAVVFVVGIRLLGLVLTGMVRVVALARRNRRA